MKVTGTHKDLVNYQYSELNMKCNSEFYQRQCGVAKRLLLKHSLEDILLVMKMFKTCGKPKEYKSIYFFEKNDTEMLIECAKEYFKRKEEVVVEEEIINEKIKVKTKLKIEL